MRPGAGTCPHCGMPLAAPTPMCGYCGRPVGRAQPGPGIQGAWGPPAPQQAAPPGGTAFMPPGPEPGGTAFMPPDPGPGYGPPGGTAFMPPDPGPGYGPPGGTAFMPPGPPGPGAQGAAPPAAASAPAPLSGGLAPLFLRLVDERLLFLALVASAAALFVFRFVPIAGSPLGVVWSWSPGIGAFQGMVWPILMAAAYAGIAFSGLLRKSPVAARAIVLGLGFVSACVTSAAFPAGLLAGGAAQGVGSLYPLLLMGLFCRIRDKNGLVGPILIGIGALGAGIAGLSLVDEIFAFSRAPVGAILHNLIWFVVLLAVLGSAVFALPSKFVPALAGVERLMPLALALFLAWLPLSALLMMLALIGFTNGLALFSLFHFLVFILAFVVVPLLAAPEALEGLALSAGKALAVDAAPPAPPGAGAPWPPGPPGVGPAQAPYGQGMPPPAAPPSVEQALAELDAAWGRGGMTPNDYHERRNAILRRG